MELRTENFKTNLGTKCLGVLETGFCRELRSLGHQGSEDGPAQGEESGGGRGAEAEMARDHKLRSHGSGRGEPTGWTHTEEGDSAAGGAEAEIQPEQGAGRTFTFLPATTLLG